MLRLSCTFDSSIGRFQLEDYIRELEITAVAYDESVRQLQTRALEKLHKLAGERMSELAELL